MDSFHGQGDAHIVRDTIVVRGLVKKQLEHGAHSAPVIYRHQPQLDVHQPLRDLAPCNAGNIC